MRPSAPLGCNECSGRQRLLARTHHFILGAKEEAPLQFTALYTRLFRGWLSESSGRKGHQVIYVAHFNHT